MATLFEANKDDLKPFSYGTQEDSAHVKAIIEKLGMTKHPEGGFFVETDRDPHLISNPYLWTSQSVTQALRSTGQRNASTTIHYLLTPSSPLGAWHRNKARTIHTLHRGRGIYVIIHADEVGGYGVDVGDGGEFWTGKARVEVFTVGPDVLKGERLQWIVEGGKYKASFLLPDHGDGAPDKSDGLLISETVVPGFVYSDHDFMKKQRLEALVTAEEAKALEWLLKKE